jgi:hypothetical protein
VAKDLNRALNEIKVFLFFFPLFVYQKFVKPPVSCQVGGDGDGDAV